MKNPFGYQPIKKWRLTAFCLYCGSMNFHKIHFGGISHLHLMCFVKNFICPIPGLERNGEPSPSHDDSKGETW